MSDKSLDESSRERGLTQSSRYDRKYSNRLADARARNKKASDEYTAKKHQDLIKRLNTSKPKDGSGTQLKLKLESFKEFISLDEALKTDTKIRKAAEKLMRDMEKKGKSEAEIMKALQINFPSLYESTAEYGKSMDRIRDRNNKNKLTSSDRTKLDDIRAMLAKEKKPVKESYTGDPVSKRDLETASYRAIGSRVSASMQVTGGDIESTIKLPNKRNAIEKARQSLEKMHYNVTGSSDGFKAHNGRGITIEFYKEGKGLYGRAYEEGGAKFLKKNESVEVEQIEEARAFKAGETVTVKHNGNKGKVVAGHPGGFYSVNFGSLSHGAPNTQKIHHSKLTNESVEQLDELSKKTLGSYIKKASQDAANSKANAQNSFKRGNDKEGFAQQDRGNKRLGGIAKAADKLTNEEVEQIEEGLVDKIRAKNYDRLAKRSHKKTVDAVLDRDDDDDWDDFDKHNKKRGARLKKAADLRKEETELEDIEQLAEESPLQTIKKLAGSKIYSKNYDSAINMMKTKGMTAADAAKMHIGVDARTLQKQYDKMKRD